MVLLVSVMLWWEFDEVGLFGKSVFLICCIAASINFIFIIVTPAAKIINSELFLYAGVQPIFFNLRPQVVSINSITNLEIAKGLIEYRAIFSLPHGNKVYYGFPATSDKMVQIFLEFLISNTDS